MAHIIYVKCNHPDSQNQHSNEVDLDKIRQGFAVFPVTTFWSRGEIDAKPIYPERLVFPCKFEAGQPEKFIILKTVLENPPPPGTEIPSAPSEPYDNFWLDQGLKLLEGSIEALRGAAGDLLTGLAALQSIYVFILGFAGFIPSVSKELKFPYTMVFLIPLIFWLVATYLTLEVLMTKKMDLWLPSPEDIRVKLIEVLRRRQAKLYVAFGLLAVGLIAVLVILGWRLFVPERSTN